MSGLISSAAKRLRDALALVTGAGLVGYSNAQAYAGGSLGAGLKAEETARANAVTAVANDVATLTASVGALSDEVDSNAAAASGAVAVVQGNVDALSLAVAALIQPGFVISHAGALAADPAGWFICDGRALNTADHPALFNAIGYTWGGAGATFNLPGTADDFIRGAGPGRAVGTREADELRSHTHLFYASENSSDSTAPDVERVSGWRAAGYNTSATGGAETRPRNVAMFFLIKR